MGANLGWAFADITPGNVAQGQGLRMDRLDMPTAPEFRDMMRGLASVHEDASIPPEPTSVSLDTKMSTACSSSVRLTLPILVISLGTMCIRSVVKMRRRLETLLLPRTGPHAAHRCTGRQGP